jgi:hypothetical protein
MQTNKDEFDEECYRELIVAIFMQAYRDAKKNPETSCCRDAKRFLRATHPGFKFYCSLLGIEPEYLYKKINEGLKLGYAISRKYRNVGK